ncbi:MAG: hypothetical protein MZV70_17320 [Desulfobacterales bacterium]|nr:hypothetical protein [Desulfobacterales bacterium]
MRHPRLRGHGDPDAQRPVLSRARKLTLELMLANHPQDCLTCDVSG